MELVFEHRHYLPMVGPLLALVCLFTTLRLRSPRAPAVAALAALALLGTFTAVRAYDWRSALSMAEADVSHHPLASRSQYEAGRALAIDGMRQT